MIPIYNLKEAFKFLKESTAESISVRLEEVDFFALLKSRTGELVSKGLIKDATQARDVIADMLKEVNWITAIFLAVTPVLGAVGLIYCQYYWQTWVLFFFHYLTGGIGITAGYHRLFSHRAYSAHPIVRPPATYHLRRSVSWLGSCLPPFPHPTTVQVHPPVLRHRLLPDVVPGVVQRPQGPPQVTTAPHTLSRKWRWVLPCSRAVCV
jgi:hypothetical protein